MSEEPQVIEGHFWQPAEGRRMYGRLEHDLAMGVTAHFVDTDLIDRSSEGPETPTVVDILHLHRYRRAQRWVALARRDDLS